jgi:predicted nucleic acid-binding protein
VTDYLADTSAVWRLLRGQIGEPWPRLVAQGVVAICPPVESELMVGVRAGRDLEPFTAVLRRTFAWVPALDDPWRQVLAVQRDLIKIGHHRGPSPMDLIIALTAEAHGLTLAHVDADFDAIAKARPGIAMVRIDQPSAP